ncbi:MAG: right-handed parallel beta-helix repeat-containing protein [Vicinamibacterales bacterium]
MPEARVLNRALALLLVLSSGSAAHAQTILYVDGSRGSDLVSREANSAATPWRTIGRAAWGSADRARPAPGEAARAGDTVAIAAGTYGFDGRIGNRWNVVYNPVNEGADGRPITFRADGVVTLTAPQAAAPVIGCYSRSFVEWHGPFTLDEASIAITPDTGPVVLANASGCGIDGALIDGNGAPKYVDNHPGVRIEGCRGCFVRNTEIVDVRHSRGNHNGSGVMLYNSIGTIVEHNVIRRVDNAVFIKGVFGGGTQSGTVVRYNLLEDCGECVTVSDSTDARISQNVIRGARFALNLLARESGAGLHPSGDWFVNNSVQDMSAACVLLGGGAWYENVRVWNNLFLGCDRVIYREGEDFPSGAGTIDWQHNVYGAFGTFAEGPGGRRGIAQWRRDFGHDQAVPASITAAPPLANPRAGDLRPCTAQGAPHPSCRGGSPVLSLGVDVLDLDRDGRTDDPVPAGAFLTGAETVGPERPAAPPGQKPPR